MVSNISTESPKEPVQEELVVVSTPKIVPISAQYCSILASDADAFRGHRHTIQSKVKELKKTKSALKKSTNVLNRKKTNE